MINYHNHLFLNKIKRIVYHIDKLFFDYYIMNNFITEPKRESELEPESRVSQAAAISPETLSKLSPKQAKYLSMDVKGPYKPEHYRY